LNPTGLPPTKTIVGKCVVPFLAFKVPCRPKMCFIFW